MKGLNIEMKIKWTTTARIVATKISYNNEWMQLLSRIVSVTLLSVPDIIIEAVLIRSGLSKIDPQELDF